MKTLNVSDNDLQLLKAIRPFMSGKSQELLDLMLTTINVFRPEQPDQKVNFDALNALLTMVHESVQTKKYDQVIEVDEYEHVPDKQSDDIENLLNILAEKEDKDE